MAVRTLSRNSDLDVDSEEGESARSEAILVDRARQGDEKAFEELVHRYERRLVRVIRRFVRDIDTAEDLAQETFIKVYKRLELFDLSRRFGPWLFQIGVNAAVDYLRQQKRAGWWNLFSQSPLERPPDPEAKDPRQDLDLKQEVAAVLQLIPEQYRSVLILRDLEGFSSAEVAAVLNRKEATVRWRLGEARLRFQSLWEKRLNGRGGVALPTAGGHSPAGELDADEA